jgi:hypothetical protein
MGDTDIGLYLLVASLLVIFGAIIAFVIACLSRRRAVRVGVGVVLLAMATVCSFLSLLAALLVAALGVAALVLARYTPRTASAVTRGEPDP